MEPHLGIIATIGMGPVLNSNKYLDPDDQSQVGPDRDRVEQKEGDGPRQRHEETGHWRQDGGDADDDADDHQPVGAPHVCVRHLAAHFPLRWPILKEWIDFFSKHEQLQIENYFWNAIKLLCQGSGAER